MADHTKAPTVYIDEMKDWYSVPPFLQDNFKVVTESNDGLILVDYVRVRIKVNC